MLIRFIYLINYALGRDIAGRTLVKFPDDVFLVGYPGSGGQWLRQLVANLMDPRHPVTESNVMQRVFLCEENEEYCRLDVDRRIYRY